MFRAANSRKEQGEYIATRESKSQELLSPWMAPTEAKRWTENLFLVISPLWIVGVLCVLVPFKLYERLDEWGYLYVGLFSALPYVLCPAILKERSADAARPLHDRYWLKANVWIAIFSFIGNYFWTHYFYRLLGADYTFPAHRINNVPITLFLMTHAYFCLYHTISNFMIRRVRAATCSIGKLGQNLSECALVFVLAYATAYAETLTIAHFPYYTFTNRRAMYRIGSLFYAIYFFVSFPMFFRIDESPRSERYSMWRVIVDALAAGMLVTCLLDFWRLGIGPIDGADNDMRGLTWHQ